MLNYHNGEKHISVHSNSPTSWNLLSKSSERLQFLHHCYTYEQNQLLHVAGDTHQILSGILIDITPTLLEHYAKLLARLYSITLQPFYEYTILSSVSSLVK